MMVQFTITGISGYSGISGATGVSGYIGISGYSGFGSYVGYCFDPIEYFLELGEEQKAIKEISCSIGLGGVYK